MMRFLLTLALAVQVLFCFGQTLFHVDKTQSDLTRTTSSTLFYDPIGISNDTTVDLPMTWQLTLKRLPQGWVTNTAIIDSVFSDTLTSGTFVLHSGANAGNLIETVFHPNGIAGSGNVTLKLFVTTDTAQQVTLIYKGTATAATTGINSVTDVDGWAIGPNPTNGLVDIKLPNGVAKAQAMVFDNLGKLLLSANIYQQNQLDLGMLPQGCYFIQLFVGAVPMAKAQQIVLH